MLDESIGNSGLEKGHKSQEKKGVVNVTLKWEAMNSLIYQATKSKGLYPSAFFRLTTVSFLSRSFSTSFCSVCKNSGSFSTLFLSS